MGARGLEQTDKIEINDCGSLYACKRCCAPRPVNGACLSKSEQITGQPQAVLQLPLCRLRLLLLRLVTGRGCLYVSLEWQTKLRLRQPIIMITIIIIIVIIISIIIIIIGAAYFYCLWAWPALVARNKAKYKTNSLHLLWKLVKHLSLYLLLFVVVVVALRLLLEKPINLIKNK